MKILPGRDRNSTLVKVILAACFLLRFSYLLATGVKAEITGDGPCYMQAAECIIHGIYPTQQPFTRPPLYPLVIAAFWGLGAYGPAAVRVLQVILDTMTCLLLVKACRSVLGEKAAVLAAAIYAVNPYFIFGTVSIQTETLYQFFIVLAGFLFVRSGQAERPDSLRLSAGIALGLSALVRPQSLLLILLLAVITAIRIKPAAIRAAAWILAGAILTVAPWTLRNAVRYGEFIPVTEGGGYSFWMGNNRALLEKFRTSDYREFLKIDRRVYLQDSVLIGKPIVNASPKERDAFWFQQGLAAIRDLGSEYPELLAYKLGVYFRPTVSPQAYGLRLSLLLLLFPGTVLVIGFVVFAGAIFRGDAALDLLVAFSLSCFLTGLALAVLFQSQLRFRVPLMDPWLIVFGAGKLAAWIFGKPVDAHSDGAIAG